MLPSVLPIDHPHRISYGTLMDWVRHCLVVDNKRRHRRRRGPWLQPHLITTIVVLLRLSRLVAALPCCCRQFQFNSVSLSCLSLCQSSKRLPIPGQRVISKSLSSSPENDNIKIEANNNMWVKLDSPPAQRNKEPIWKVLSTEILPKLNMKGDVRIDDVDDNDDPASVVMERPPSTPVIPTTVVRVLEIAAGCGVHTQHFCLQLKKTGWKDHFVWYPTDPDATSRASIQSYLEEAALAEDVMAPLPLRLEAHGIREIETRRAIFDESLDLIVCINMIHISPWEATVGLMTTAQEKLRLGGFLYCYGPYMVNGAAVASNLMFDRNLRLRDPSWGVRDLEKVQQLAKECGLELVKTIEMPANNLSLVFRKHLTLSRIS